MNLEDNAQKKDYEKIIVSVICKKGDNSDEVASDLSDVGTEGIYILGTDYEELTQEEWKKACVFHGHKEWESSGK